MVISKRVDTQYIAKINDRELQFDSYHDMCDYIQNYRENHNEIHQISMFKIKVYSLI